MTTPPFSSGRTGFSSLGVSAGASSETGFASGASIILTSLSGPGARFSSGGSKFPPSNHSTVTLFARLRGLSISHPLSSATW
jgi:hypothetical protein